MRSAGYITEGKLDNQVVHISESDLLKLRDDFLLDLEENKKITDFSYRNQTIFPNIDSRVRSIFENVYQDQKTYGSRIQYPHGIVMRQAGFRHFYRGENKIYDNTESTLCRGLKRFELEEERELYRIICDMRIFEFRRFINHFEHVKKWNYSDVLHDCIAQHYGLETAWLDMTSSFDVALFFATCFYKDGKWYPLSKNETEQEEKTRYGMLFHIPSYQMKSSWCLHLQDFADLTPLKTLANLIYPIGFQPFMRCHMQYGHAIYMGKSFPLQVDFRFEKLRFKHDEEVSKRIYDRMEGGERIYPHEGLQRVDDIIEQIKTLMDFTDDALLYALKRSHVYVQKDLNLVKRRLQSFSISGNRVNFVKRSVIHLPNRVKKQIDRSYEKFSIEDYYNIYPVSRPAISDKGQLTGAPMYEPYMLLDEENGKGVCEFKPRRMEEANLWTETLMYDMKVLLTKNADDFDI